MSAGKWILGGLGFVLGGPIGAVIGVLIASFFESDTKKLISDDRPYSSSESTTSGRNTTRHASPNDIRISLLVLAACVMKADGHVKKSELEVVKSFLRKNYGESASEALNILRNLLEQNIDYMSVAKQVGENVNYSTKLTILQFLVNIANADGNFCGQEQYTVEQIARGLGISTADFESIAAIYNPKKDQNWAYKALEIEPTATNEEVKKAYRRMAMKYHPDKVASAGEEMKEKATEKFRAINEAYEQIKLLRNFN